MPARPQTPRRAATSSSPSPSSRARGGCRVRAARAAARHDASGLPSAWGRPPGRRRVDGSHCRRASRGSSPLAGGRAALRPGACRAWPPLAPSSRAAPWLAASCPPSRLAAWQRRRGADAAGAGGPTVQAWRRCLRPPVPAAASAQAARGQRRHRGAGSPPLGCRDRSGPARPRVRRARAPRRTRASAPPSPPPAAAAAREKARTVPAAAPAGGRRRTGTVRAGRAGRRAAGRSAVPGIARVPRPRARARRVRWAQGRDNGSGGATRPRPGRRGVQAMAAAGRMAGLDSPFWLRPPFPLRAVAGSRPGRGPGRTVSPIPSRTRRESVGRKRCCDLKMRAGGIVAGA